MKDKIQKHASILLQCGLPLLVLALTAGPALAARPTTVESPCRSWDVLLKSSSGGNYLEVCIGEKGNLVRFVGNGGGHLSREGYRVCYLDPRYDDGGHVAYTFGTQDAGWGAATVTGSANNLPIKITRTTNDGVLKLTQVFNRDPKNRALTIESTVTNNLSGNNELNYFSIDRIFDGDIEGKWINTHPHYGNQLGSAYERNYNGSTVFARGPTFALLLTSLTLTPGDPFQPDIREAATFDPAVCLPGERYYERTDRGDWVGLLKVWIRSLKPGQSVTKIFKYEEN